MRPTLPTIVLALPFFALTGCESWFFDYTTAHLAVIDRLNRDAAAINTKVKIAFDPARETIVAPEAVYLIQHYRLNVAYVRDDYYKGRPQEYRTHNMVRYPRCSRPSERQGNGYSIGSYYPGLHPGICTLTVYGEAPPRSALTTTIIQRPFVIEGYNIWRWQILISRPDGRQVSLLHFRGPQDSEQTTGPLIASALGLQPRNGQFANLPGPGEVDRWIAASIASVDTPNFAQLDVLAETGQLPANSSFSAHQIAPTEIAKRANKLVGQFENLIPSANANHLNDVGTMLARLPQDNWVRYRKRIMAALMVAPKDMLDHQPQLVLRLAELGADAAPLLARASSEKHIRNYAEIAACRIGASANQQLRDNFLASWKISNLPHLKYAFERRDRDTFNGRGIMARQRWKRCFEDGKANGPPDDITFSACWYYPETGPEASRTYLALKRMGLGPEADAIARHQYSRHWKKTYALVGPQSDPKICGTEKDI